MVSRLPGEIIVMDKHMVGGGGQCFINTISSLKFEKKVGTGPFMCLLQC